MGRAAAVLGLLSVVGALTIAAVPVSALSVSGGLLPLPAGAPPAVFVPSSARVTVAPAFVPPPGVSDLGPVPPSRTVSVDVGLAPRAPAALEAAAVATAVPGTPSYRHFLSAAAADERFGADPAAVAAAESYFQGFGLTAETHPDGLLLSVSGPGPDLARAFGTTLELYRAPSGATFVDHPGPASLPALAPWSGVLGLSSETAFRPAVLGGLPVPSAGPTCPAPPGTLVPCQVADAYDYAGLDANGTNGSGERIAVIDPYSWTENQTELASDMATFSHNLGLAPASFTFRYPVPSSADLNASGTNTLWNFEDALDPEWAHASAPGAAIEMVFSPNPSAGLYFAIDWVVATGAANVISMSWGEPEVGIFNAAVPPLCHAACNASSDGSFEVLGPVLELAAVEGITAVAASGDCGSADGTSGVAASFPASDPFVTGVGATNLTLTSTDGYRSESAWGGNGSGAVSPGCVNQGGSGGGFSVLDRPWWQSGKGTAPTRGRGVPDVAIVGGTASPVVIYAAGVRNAVAGTSVGTPIWAGIAATLDQAAGGALGWLNPGIYRVLSGANYSEDFHAITSGSNGYSTHTGWNPVTGVGTPIVANLSRDLSSTGSTGTNLSAYVFASPRFGAAPLTVRFATSFTGGTGTYPLEGIAFGDGNSSLVSGGMATHTFPHEGVYSAQAYAVDSSGNTSASPPVVVVVGGGGPLSVQLNATTTSPAVGGSVTFNATASGGTGPYRYNFSFGDGSFAVNLTSPTIAHAYPLAGAFCAEVVVRDSGSPPRGAASLRLAEAVGGAAPGTCGNPSHGLSITTSGSGSVRDAPADFPSMFTVSGGSSAPDGLPFQVGLVSGDPYTAACGCTILRQAGTYTLREWVNDSVGEEASANVTVTVAPPLVAAFSASTLSGLAPLSVNFSASVSGGFHAHAADTRWDLGNGILATGATAGTTYTAPGEYVAVASLSDAGFGNASEAFVIDAEAATAPGLGLTATVTPAVNVSSGAPVAWTATEVGSSSERAGTFVAWAFGNGGSAFGRFANESFFTPGDLPVGNALHASVAVDDPLVAPLIQVPVVLSGFFAVEAAGFVPAVSALNLSATLPSSVGLVPLPVDVSANTSGPGGTAVTWTFGDGGTASGSSASHVYYAAGEYTVGVQARDTFGDTAGRLSALVVNAALAVTGCGPSVLRGSAPFTVHLTPAASGGTGPPYGYRWTLPNGTVSTATDQTLTFDSGGTYEVSLVVTDASSAAYGCSWAIVVRSVPPVTFVDILAGGIVAGIVLAVVFVVVTRPPPEPYRPDTG